jgi:tRNA(adenine34) deaminase
MTNPTTLIKTDQFFMQQALMLARHASSLNEVPVGAVLVLNQDIIGRGYNQPISANDPSAHAEIIALRDAAQNLGNYRLINTTLYVTLEPCPMCAYALLHARIARLVYATPDPRSGACGGAIDLFKLSRWNHNLNYSQGPLTQECSSILSEFFQSRR